jgi:hypothetical protein
MRWGDTFMLSRRQGASEAGARVPHVLKVDSEITPLSVTPQLPRNPFPLLQYSDASGIFHWRGKRRLKISHQSDAVR